MRRLLPLLILLAIVAAGSVSFTQNVSINSGLPAFTDDNLVCTWQASGDTTAVNVTWFRNEVYNRSTYDPTGTATSDTVAASETLKNQAWRCRVTIFNATANTMDEYNLTIQNSAPETPIIYNGSTDIGTSIAVVEDVPITLDANSSDVDIDTLTYYFKNAKFCTMIDTAAGTANCSATHEYLVNGSEVENQTRVNITFWVDDDDPLFAKSASRTITFNITPVNDAPSLTMTQQQVNVSDVFNETFNASDEENDYPLIITLDYANTDPEIRDDVTVTTEGNNTVRIVYETSPTDYNDVGNRTVSLNLTDDQSASATTNFTLEILGVNRYPYFVNFTPDRLNSSVERTYVINQGEQLLINITANDFDTNTTNQTLTFSDNASLFVIETVNGNATNTSNARGRINYTGMNADVGMTSILVTVADQFGLENSTTINITVLNVNDPPELYNQSFDANNTNGNVNLTHLVGFLAAPFYYQINYSDPDIPYGDTVTFSDNSSVVNVSNTGVINFTPSGLPGNETINITVTDGNGSIDWRSVLFEIQNNSPPYFNDTFPVLTCGEGVPCFFNVSYYAKDDDTGNVLASYAGSVTNGTLDSFTINATTGTINFTPIQSEIGNATVRIRIEDTPGASETQNLAITITNTPDTPSWTRVNFSSQTIVEDKAFLYEIRARDPDLLLGIGENTTFTTNITWFTISATSYANDTAIATLSFTPNSTQLGNHTAQMNATDATGRVNSTNITFTVLASTQPPNVTGIRPYGNATDGLTQAWLDVTGATVKEENVSLNENTSSVTFEANATDDVTPPGNFIYSWYYDGSLVASSEAYTRSFDFFSSGVHTLTVTINDTTLEHVNWTWNLDIANVNREPTLVNNLTSNLTIESITTYTDYFLKTDNKVRFFDPDDDLDSSGEIDGSETQSLTYTSSACSVATIEAVGNSLKLTPTAVGSCTVAFTATDSGGLSMGSNLVEITVTEVPLTETQQESNSGGGGSSSNSRSSFVPFEEEVESPEPLSIITPGESVIYENASVTIPIKLRSNWSEPLKGVTLSASTNMTDVKLFLSETVIPRIDPNETYEVELTAVGYRLGETFEVKIEANVSDPEYSDSALVLFSTIEQSGREDGAESLNIKVTFARDLLTANSECQELSSLLNEAEALISAGETGKGVAMVDQVINGCKYMISQVKQREQRPGTIQFRDIELSRDQLETIALVAAGIFALLVAGIFYGHHRTKEKYDF